ALGAERVETRDGGYRVVLDRGELDADRFDALVRDGRTQEGLALWRGDPLAGLDERFARTAAAALDERRLAALEQRIDDDIDAGRHAALVSELDRLVGEH